MKLSSFLKIFFFTTTLVTVACAQQEPRSPLSELPPVITDPANYNELSPEAEYVIREEGTERAFTGAYYNYKKEGIYICRQCNNPLFRSSDKFDSGTGWPSYDDAIEGAVKKVPDGSRTEIECANCGGHLGHVFRGEGFTDKGIRHCVNSLSLNFVKAESSEKSSDSEVQPIEEYIAGNGYEKYQVATFAGGCFWCTEASFDRIQGVVDVISGYSGGKKKYPTYKKVAAGRTDHAESIQIYFDPEVVSFETLLDVFFTAAHDPTQLNRQGPDVGAQYRSAVFYHSEEQKKLTEKTIQELEQSGMFSDPIVTKVEPYKEFWVAEGYHQDYYPNNPDNTYIQQVSKPKVEKVEKKFKDILKEDYR